MNLKEIISSTDRYNFHTHTQYCDGRATMTQMARAAVRAGIKHLGFSPHSPLPFETSCNMTIGSVADYFMEIDQIRQEFGDELNVYRGMEIDYLSPNVGPSSEFYRKMYLDFSIGSVHFIKNQKGEYVDVDGKFESFKEKMNLYFEGDINYVVKEFYRASREMLALGQFDILGHFDKISQNASYYKPGIEDKPWYRELVNHYIDEIIASGVIVEINTKARVEHGRFFPNEKYWKRLIDAKVPLMVNSDCHYPEKIDLSRREAFELLKSMK